MHVFYDKRKKVFDKYNEIWEKVSNITKTKFNSEVVTIKKWKQNQNQRRLSLFLYTNDIDWFSL